MHHRHRAATATIGRCLVLFACVSVSHILHSQPVDWKGIVARHNAREHPLPVRRLARAKRNAIRSLLLQSQADIGTCNRGDTSWANTLAYNPLNLGPRRTTLVQVNVSCARSAQGANGAMWIVDDAGTPAVLVATLEGWFDGVQPARSHGWHDFTIGWHNNCCSYGLALYRFNGTSYRDIADVQVACDEEDHCTVRPYGAVATPTKLSAQP